MIQAAQLNAADEGVASGASEDASGNLALGVGPLLFVVALGGIKVYEPDDAHAGESRGSHPNAGQLALSKAA